MCEDIASSLPIFGCGICYCGRVAVFCVVPEALFIYALLYGYRDLFTELVELIILNDKIVHREFIKIVYIGV